MSAQKSGLLTTLVIALVTVLLIPMSSYADPSSEIKEMREKLERLEKEQAELYHSLEEKKSPGLMEKISQRVSLGGLVEVEASYEYNDVNAPHEISSDAVLATVELGFDADIHEKVKGHVLLLWEEDDTDPIDMDEGTITVDLIGGLSFTGGKFYIPFGVFNSHFISDPLVLELGETNESAVQLSYGNDFFEASIGIFNGHLEEAGSDDVLEDWFASIAVTPLEGFEIGAYYTSDLSDSDLMTDTVFDGVSEIGTTIGGFGGYLSASLGLVTLEAEYIGAAESFDVADIALMPEPIGDKPRAFNVELALSVNDKLEVVAKWEGSRDFTTLLPEVQYGVAASYGLYENVTVALEYLHGEFNDEGITRDLVTAQLAVEF